MNRPTIGAPAAWDALDAILPPLPAEHPTETISCLEAVRRRFVDELPRRDRFLVDAVGRGAQRDERSRT